MNKSRSFLCRAFSGSVKVVLVFGTRPEAIKMAPVIKELKDDKRFTVRVCVTAQHRTMLDQVMETFHIKSDYDLDIMLRSQSLYQITTNVLSRLRPVLVKEKPDLVLVHGDTTTTFGAALGSFYQKIPVGHVEAGLRSGDRYNPYPEEANRVLTDSLCSLHFAPTQQARENLLGEGTRGEKIFITGNTVIDALYLILESPPCFKNRTLRKIFRPSTSTRSPSRVLLVTAHRRENWGAPLKNICLALRKVVRQYRDVRVVFPVHLNPNVREQVYGLLGGVSNIYLTPPLDYLDFAGLMKNSYMVVTDSGGLQEEAPSLGKPVLVVRKVTERPEAVRAGTVKVIGTGRERVFSEIKDLMEDKKKYLKMSRAVNPYGDGKAARRIKEAILYYFGKQKGKPLQFHYKGTR